MFGFCSPFFIKTVILHFWGDYDLMYTSIMALLHLKLQFNLVKVKVSGCIDIIFQCCPKVESFHPTLAKSNILHHLLTSEQFSPQYGKWIHLSYQIRCSIPSQKNIFKLLKIKAIFFRNSNVLLLSGFLVVMEIMIELVVSSCISSGSHLHNHHQG